MLAVIWIALPPMTYGSASCARIFSAARKCALIVRNLREKNDELVTALTTRRIASSDAGQQARGDSLEQLVTGRMPECVIDGFEAVKVEIEQRELRSHPRRLRHGLVKAIQQQEAIGKTGERIEVSPPMRLCVRSLEQAQLRPQQ